MKAKDLRERSVEDLRELEKSLTRDTFTHRFKNFTNQLDDTSLIAKAKRDLARVKTLLRQQALVTATKAAEGDATTKSEAK
jgi:large subunit ribosomal protein L29